MEEGLRTREKIFEALLEKESNRKHWEMLCNSAKPKIPFIGAGMSAWCYCTWKNLLIEIVNEIYDAKCSETVKQALECKEKPDVEDKDNFHWMEEIAECIFNADPKLAKRTGHANSENADNIPNELLDRLQNYIGREDRKKKKAATEALYTAFDRALPKEKGKMPEYQHYFPILFPDILVTTNYDNALEYCYSSILNYTYQDLNDATGANTSKHTDNCSPFILNYIYQDLNKKTDTPENANHSWLYLAVSFKLKNSTEKLLGKDKTSAPVTVPEMPMLLKVHGSIERAPDIALTREGYNKAYQGEMPMLLQKIFQESTLIFMGYSLREDRIMDELKKCKNNQSNIRHFAFLPLKEKDDTANLAVDYNIYPIYFDETLLEDLIKDEKERKSVQYDYFLGLLLQNLARRETRYPKPLELLWEKNRFKKDITIAPNDLLRQRLWEQKREQFVRYKQALQIWKVLNFSGECPLIAITGKKGMGKSTFCRSIQELQKGYKNPMQFLYISLGDCSTWNEFCIRIYEELNIMEFEIPHQKSWKTFAKIIAERCAVYWRSVLVLDHLDGLRYARSDENAWKTIKEVLKYWKGNSTRVIFITCEYPDGIPCYTWHMDKLGAKEATEVFFNFCNSGQSREISYLEKKVVSELFIRHDFQPMSLNLLGRYANSKNDLTSLLEEWKFYHKAGNTSEQTLALIIWNHLLEEHQYKKNTYTKIKGNIFWVWSILSTYPGNCPKEFFESFCKNKDGCQEQELTEKTLMFMKNVGLCEEQESEEQRILLENMVDSVHRFFCNFAEESLQKDFKFMETVKDNEKKNYGLNRFRGYFMHSWNQQLSDHIWEKLKETDPEETKQSPKKNILKFLEELGKLVQTSEDRAKNRGLDLVLHYEIKTISRLLYSYLHQYKEDHDTVEQIINISVSFSHYYHYLPNCSMSLISSILSIMDSNATVANHKNDLYKLAKMYQVMGDILRFMGKKEEAILQYEKTLTLCNEQLINACCQNKETENKKNCMRIKADALLSKSYFQEQLSDDEKKELEESSKIYKKLGDNWGEAYFNHRMGERLYAEIKEFTVHIPQYNIDGTQTESGELKNFHKIKKHYETALDFYRSENCNDMSRIAYVKKSMADLIVKYPSSDPDDTKWFEDAVNLYLEAFHGYYCNINWRGLANVLQAMETCCRILNDEKAADLFNSQLYDFAEECYRWLGDIRGLADTLDYSGHEYKKKEKYKALNKWMESKELWKKLGNKRKLEQATEHIINLEKAIKKQEKNNE